MPHMQTCDARKEASFGLAQLEHDDAPTRSSYTTHLGKGTDPVSHVSNPKRDAYSIECLLGERQGFGVSSRQHRPRTKAARLHFLTCDEQHLSRGIEAYDACARIVSEDF